MPANGAIERVIERQVARRGGAERQPAAELSNEGWKHCPLLILRM